MLQQPLADPSRSSTPSTETVNTGGRVERRATRVGDMAAMLRLMRPLNGTLSDPTLRRRRLLADLCRLVGASVGSKTSGPVTRAVDPSDEDESMALVVPAQLDGELSPRLEQTLRHLLN